MPFQLQLPQTVRWSLSVYNYGVVGWSPVSMTMSSPTVDATKAQFCTLLIQHPVISSMFGSNPSVYVEARVIATGQLIRAFKGPLSQVRKQIGCL